MPVVRFFALAIVFFALTSFGQPDLPKSFTDLLSRGDMMFETPDSMVSTPVIPNRPMAYNYALKYPAKNFEVRFAVRPTDEMWKQFKLTENDKKKDNVNYNPDSAYMSAFQTTLLNISATSELPKITDFEKNAVKEEFGADWGGTAFVYPSKLFGQNYKYCMVVCIHKNHAGDAFIFFLSDSKDGFNELVLPAFHALKFNNF